MTKFMLTDLIASATEIQKEWAVAGNEDQAQGGQQNGEPPQKMPWPGKVLDRSEPDVQKLWETQADMATDGWATNESQHIFQHEPMGPLRPEHLREAWGGPSKERPSLCLRSHQAEGAPELMGRGLRRASSGSKGALLGRA